MKTKQRILKESLRQKSLLELLEIIFTLVEPELDKKPEEAPSLELTLCNDILEERIPGIETRFEVFDLFFMSHREKVA